ncbi:MAG: zinc-binding dehydrogenase [Chloroflexi bacterium]|nr:zinc-binding dehydrogenase [Chloroflexota bacterium]
MKAVVKAAPGVGNVEVRDVQEPEVPPGQVKIAVRAAGICGTDLHIYYDEYRSRPPVVLGHEVSGQVAEVGAGVERVRVGERVTTETYVSTCGVCRFCRAGRINLCPQRRSIGSAVDGGFTSYLVVPEGNVHRLPERVSYLAGALTEPLACVVHGALELPRLLPGDLAVIAGPGTIGLLTLQVVKGAGARVVVLGTDADGHRLQLAVDLGADRVFDVGRDDYRGAMDELTGGSGADIVYECSGAGPAAQMLLDLVRRGGQYVQIGLFGKPIAWDLEQVCYKELAVMGSNASVPSAWTRALDLMATGAVQTEPLVSGQLPITAWPDAFDAFERRVGLKTVLYPVEEVSA